MTTATADTGPGSWSWDTVEAILTVGTPVAAACTGGGSLGLSWLLNHPGASRAVLEVQVPYAAAAVDAYLGLPGPHRCVEETARRLAAAAHRRALGLGAAAAVGLGLTAALATDRARRGDDRAFVATRTQGAYGFAEVRFDRGGDRLAQEDALSRVLLGALAEACAADRPGPALPSWVRVERAAAPVDALVEALLAEEAAAVEFVGERARAVGGGEPRLLVCGSFNPLHAGHAGLATAAERRSGRPAAFELSVRNVDKPALPYREILRRAAQPRGGRDLVLTREPTFLGKARQLPGSWFAIGYDTAVRVVEPSYYDGTAGGMQAALTQLRELGSRFLVASRDWEGAFRGLADVPVPAGFDDLFEAIPEHEFRADVSSTQLRQEGA